MLKEYLNPRRTGLHSGETPLKRARNHAHQRNDDGPL
jgi:hypothetical protein